MIGASSFPQTLASDVATPSVSACDREEWTSRPRVSGGGLMRNFRSLLPCLLWAACLLPSSAPAQGVVVREYELKAGVLNLVGKLVTWPAAAAPTRERPLIIGVLGKDSFLEGGVNQLDRVVAEEGKKDRTIVIKRFDSAKDYEPCHILLVSSKGTPKSAEKTLEERIAAAKKETAGKPVLLAGDSAGMAKQGVAANLVYDRVNDLIQLEINPDAVGRAGLKMPPQLLRLAVVKIVRDANK